MLHQLRLVASESYHGHVQHDGAILHTTNIHTAQQETQYVKVNSVLQMIKQQ